MKTRKLFSALTAFLLLITAVPAVSLATGSADLIGETLATNTLDSVWTMIDSVEQRATLSGMSRSRIINSVYTAALNHPNVDPDGFYYFDNDGFFFTVNGMCCAYDYRLRNELDLNAQPIPESEKTVLIKGSGKAALKDAESPHVLLVAPYYGHDSSFTDQYQIEAASIARETGGDYLLIQSTNATGPAIAENFPDKGVVIYDSHGSQSGTSSYLCLTTKVGITQEDYKQGWAVNAGSSAYIDGRYIENHITTPLSNTFVWMAICEGMKFEGRGTTGNALLNAGAGAVYGYSQSVTFGGDYLYEETFWTEMKDNKATVAEAYARMVDTHGVSDPYGDYDTAYPIVMSPLDPFPADPDSPQTVYCDWTLFGELPPIALEECSVSSGSVTLYEGYTVNIDFSRVPENANDYHLVWSCTDPSVATVAGNNRKAVITGLHEGTATVYCAVMKGDVVFGVRTVALTVVPDTGLYDSLNIDGGSLDFTSTGSYRFIAETEGGRQYAVSSNRGVNNSVATLEVNLSMKADETLSFDYFFSTEAYYDFYTFEVNGKLIMSDSGESGGWQSYTFTAVADGNYRFTWSYSKDEYMAEGSDCVKIDNVAYSGSNAYKPGDVDGNGSIEITDSVIAMRAAMGLYELTNDQTVRGDIDGSGTINITDAITILRMAMGINASGN